MEKITNWKESPSAEKHKMVKLTGHITSTDTNLAGRFWSMFKPKQKAAKQQMLIESFPESHYGKTPFEMYGFLSPDASEAKVEHGWTIRFLGTIVGETEDGVPVCWIESYTKLQDNLSNVNVDSLSVSSDMNK